MERWLRLQRRVEEAVLSWGILTIAALMVANVVVRRFLGFSLTFGEEISQLLIVVICFLGLSYAASQRRHIRMTAFLERMQGRRRALVETWIAVSTAVLLLALTVWAVRYVLVVADLGSVTPVLRLPLYLVYLVAPVGFLLSALHYLGQARAWHRYRGSGLPDWLPAEDRPVTSDDPPPPTT